MSSQILTASRDKALSLRHLLTGGAQLTLTELTSRTLHITSTLDEDRQRIMGFLFKTPKYAVYVDGIQICESRSEQNYDMPTITAKFSNGDSIVVAEREFPLKGTGLPGTIQNVSLAVPGFKEKKQRSLTFAELSQLSVGSVVLVSYPFQRVTDTDGTQWLTDGDLLAFPLQPPPKEERLQYPYALIPLGYWQEFCQSLEGKLITFPNALTHFAMGYMMSIREGFHWVIGEDGEEYLTNGEYFFREKARPHVMQWTPHAGGGIDPQSHLGLSIEREIADVLPEYRRAFLDSLVGYKYTTLHPCLVAFHQTVPCRWVEDASGSRWLTNGFSKMPAGRDPQLWLIPVDIPIGFWDDFIAGLEGLTMDQIRDYARRYVVDIVTVFRWVTEGGQRYMSNGQSPALPEECPRGSTEWKKCRPLVQRAIERRYWMPYLLALEGKPLDAVLNIEPSRLIREAREVQPPALNERQRRVRDVIAKLWTGGGRCDPIKIGTSPSSSLLFPVNRADELGNCSVVDVPKDLSIYAFEDPKEAERFARELIARSKIRPVQCHIDHIGDDWDAELEWILSNVAAADFKNPARWRRPKES